MSFSRRSSSWRTRSTSASAVRTRAASRASSARFWASRASGRSRARTMRTSPASTRSPTRTATSATGPPMAAATVPCSRGTTCPTTGMVCAMRSSRDRVHLDEGGGASALGRGRRNREGRGAEGEDDGKERPGVAHAIAVHGQGAGILARIFHRCPAADTNLLAVAGRTPSSRFDVVSATPSAARMRSFSPCGHYHKHLGALATNIGEICGLAVERAFRSSGARCGAVSGVGTGGREPPGGRRRGG